MQLTATFADSPKTINYVLDILNFDAAERPVVSEVVPIGYVDDETASVTTVTGQVQKVMILIGAVADQGHSTLLRVESI